MATKRCSKCRELKELGRFHRSAVSRDGHHARCKACRNEATRAYRQRRIAAEQAAEAAAEQLRARGVEVDS